MVKTVKEKIKIYKTPEPGGAADTSWQLINSRFYNHQGSNIFLIIYFTLSKYK